MRAKLISPHALFLVALPALLLVGISSLQAAKKGEVTIRMTDAKTGKPIAVRMHLKDAKGKPVKPRDAVAWHDHFSFDHEIKLELPEGNYTFEMERGLEYKNRTGNFFIEDKASDVKELTLERFTDLTEDGWYSGDLALHRSPAEMETLLKADDLYIAPLIAWTNKQTAKAFDAAPVKTSDGRYYQFAVGRDAREGGPLLLFGLPAPLAVKDVKTEHPSSLFFLDQAKEINEALAIAERPSAWDLPAWIATGRLDSMLVVSPELHRDGNLGKIEKAVGEKPRDRQLFPAPHGAGRWSQEVYFHLLNCGLRLPPAAGSGSGIEPNPPGYSRVYVNCGSEFTWENWWKGLKAGRAFITNGPVMTPRVNNELPGHVFQAAKGEALELSISMNLATREKISYLEVIKDGVVVDEVRLDKWAENNGVLPPVRFTESGWMLVRAVTSNSSTYRYAMSAPFYVEIDYKPRISKKSAQFFADWVLERAKRIKLDDAAEKEEVIAYHRAARDYWKALVEKANAE